jgi:hypothetical protein
MARDVLSFLSGDPWNEDCILVDQA